MSRRRDSDDPAGDEPGHERKIRGLPPEWGTIVIPDDLRELADEVAQIQAELAVDPPASGRNRWPWRRSALAGPLLALILFLVAAIGSLLVVVLPRPGRPPRSDALISTAVAVGVTGGLPPGISLRDGRSRATPIRQLRPAVLLLSPAACRTCATVRNQLMILTAETQLTMALITESKTALTLAPGSATSRTVSLADPTGSVRRAVRGASATGPTAVLIRSDGRIGEVAPDVTDPGQLRPELAALTGR